MDSFELRPTRSHGVLVVINGQDLRELVREAEIKFATKEGHPKIAGAYSGLPPEVVFLPSRHFLGEPHPSYSEGTCLVHVLECECGEPGCWPLAARINLTQETVQWSDFMQPHRSSGDSQFKWDYGSLPVFRFRLASYMQALQKP